MTSNPRLTGRVKWCKEGEALPEGWETPGGFADKRDAEIERLTRERDELLADAQRLNWYESQHTLHKNPELLYVVDGYEISMMEQDGQKVVAEFFGKSIRDCIDAAMKHRPADEPQKP
jgi:hypothetical protein